MALLLQEAKYGIILQIFSIVWLVQFLEKNAINLNFHDEHFFIKIWTMGEQEKKWQRIYDLTHAETKMKNFLK